jgi:hypothetical protein
VYILYLVLRIKTKGYSILNLFSALLRRAGGAAGVRGGLPPRLLTIISLNQLVGDDRYFLI